MSGHYAAEQVEQQYLEAMGPELGKIFHRLWNECAWLHWKWGGYVELFGTAPERIALLNRAAPSFFFVVQDSLWNDVLLHICRLTDPPQSAGKHNLTIQRLAPIVVPALRPRVETLLEGALRKCEFALDWRKRHIAHRDLSLALRESSTALAPASRLFVKEALEAISAVLNVIDRHYRNSEVAYGGIAPAGDAEALLYVIRDGLEADDQRTKRRKSGHLLPEDLKAPSAV